MELDVMRIAKLAKLHLPEEELESFQAHVEILAGMVDNLPELEGEIAAPDPANAMPLRADVVGASLTAEQALQNAPDKQAGCFVVPKTV